MEHHTHADKWMGIHILSVILFHLNEQTQHFRFYG